MLNINVEKGAAGDGAASRSGFGSANNWKKGESYIVKGRCILMIYINLTL
jgi:hypothetical protein